MDKKEILKEEFKERSGFGVTGSALSIIAKRVAELYGSKHIQINVPYHGFNCKGTANKVAKDVVGVMPFSKKRVRIEDTTTLFYGDKCVKKPSYYLPFLGDCDVFFISSVNDINGIIEINLIKAPSWRMYL